MTLLEEKHCDVLMTNGLSYVQLSKECAKITLQHCIDVLNDIGNPSSFNKETTYGFLKMKLLELNQQLSDLK